MAHLQQNMFLHIPEHTHPHLTKIRVCRCWNGRNN